MPEKTAAMPAIGKCAPAVKLPSDSGEDITLSALKGRPVVLYFYPKDNTPGCTIEAQEFRDAIPAFTEAGATVLGVSTDSVKSHCGFRDKQNLNFPLLADTDHAVAEKYGVWVEKTNYGKTYMGIQRATFLVDKNGKIAQIWPKVTPKGHAQEVLDAVKSLP